MDDPELHFGQQNFTLSMWLYPTSFSGIDYTPSIRVMEATNQYPAGPWWAIDLYNDGTVYVFMAEGTNDGGGIGRARSTGSLPLDAWTHVTIVVDRANFTTTYYFNGVLDSEKTIEAEFDGDLSPSSFLSIGSVWNPFSGKIDEVIIYNRALSLSEVADLYNS